MINEAILRENIYQHVIKIGSSRDIFDLFKILGYPENIVLDKSSRRKKSDFDFRKEDEERIKEIFSILIFEKDLSVFFLETTTLSPSFVRSVANTFDKQYLQYLLIFTVNYSEISFVLPDKEKVEAGKHKLKLTKLTLNKKDIENKSNYYSVIQTLANMEYEDNAGWRDIWKKWKKAFSVERVTKEFFERYKEIFFKLKEDLYKQKIPRKESHEFTLQFLNRIMFIYFISKKNWLEKPNFIDWLWSFYKRLRKSNSDEFYEKWLKQIFLKAFNNRADEIKDLPDEVINVISSAPYLNGGLFKENDLDKLKIQISDELFQKILKFFESYNFTIKEDIPLESEVAVDPQMIGYVYESLANVAEEIYDRKDLGIFYTPIDEVYFMCRRSLVEYLSKNLSEIPKDKFYHLLFDPLEERDNIENWFTKENSWRKLEETLNGLSVVDPACGSGAFLVGMLNVVSEIYKIIYKYLKSSMTDSTLKNRIIQFSLYGVDVMPWAIQAAELRLWLQLIVETDFKKEVLRQSPLLPNLNLNLRVGDSLVQEIGGVSFNLRTNNLKPYLKRKLDDLKQEKRKYFENSPNRKFITPEEVKVEEIRLFEDIIDERVESLEGYIQVCGNEIKEAKKQVTLAGEHIIDGKKVSKNEEKIELNKNEISKLKSLKEHLKEPEKKPFVWDIDFAEIFADKNGFDIVIGNPPYVRQEMISPPNRIKSAITKMEKDGYKEKLIKSVKMRFPVIKDVSKRSDYYIYFYFHGLSLLNSNGTFCFITSNSWLDVEYGKVLQEFLCKYVPITSIYDNPKRSFTHAYVNTTIALLGAPEIRQRKVGEWSNELDGGNAKIWSNIKSTAKFVMFKKPFEEVLSTQNLIDIDNVKVKVKSEGVTELVKNIIATDDYRIFPIIQEDLLDDGWVYPDKYKNGRFKAGNYEGNKWGGKFLIAPDIFFKILEKGKGKLIELRTIAKVKTGCYSGIDDFFYFLRNPTVKVEECFVKKIIISPKQIENITINKNTIKTKVFICNKSKEELIKYPEALNYILWGESQVTRKHMKTPQGIAWPRVESVKKRKKGWWVIPENNVIPVKNFLPLSIKDRFYSPFSEEPIISDRCFHRIIPNEEIDELKLSIALNNSVSFLIMEIFGNRNLGLGALDFGTDDANKLLILNPDLIENTIKDRLKYPIVSIFDELGINSTKPIRAQEPKPLPDRLELDNIIFDELGLTPDERNEVYWDVCELIKQRIDKVNSVKKKNDKI
jgi:hypothetical protein